ncbi:hypothetical protein FGB62_41g12 [Gracilaria domingensis]|nr:hypothetical protein FGB62_41g12 [Gracilaria domingensis]
MSHFSRTRGRLPKETYEGKYSAELTERYRCSAVECRLNIFIAARHRGLPIADEYLINEIHRSNREGRYARRHQSILSETIRSSKRTDHVRSRERGGEISAADNYADVLADAIMDSDQDVKITRKIVKDNISSTARNDIGRSPSRSSSALVRQGDGINGNEKGDAKSFCEKETESTNDKQQSMRSETVEDLPGYFFQLMKEGCSYGVHLRLHKPPVVNYRVTTRVRCLKYKVYPKGSECRAGIVGKLSRDLRRWDIKGENSHNNERIKKCCRSTLRILYIRYTPERGSSKGRTQREVSATNEQRQGGSVLSSGGQADGKESLETEITVISDSDDEDFMQDPSTVRDDLPASSSMPDSKALAPVAITRTVEEEVLADGVRNEDLTDDCQVLQMNEKLVVKTDRQDNHAASKEDTGESASDSGYNAKEDTGENGGECGCNAKEGTGESAGVFLQTCL